METSSHTPQPPKPSSPDETIANHDDLLTQILLRLEAKSLIRYQCVSKHWLSLISSPKFREHHTLRNPSPPLSALFFLSDAKNLTFVSLSGGPRSNPLDSVLELRGVKILQSCNGLLLCCSGGGDTSRREFYVVNPATSQYSQLPAHTFGYQLVDSLGVAIAFDPCKSGRVDYKVVAVWTVSLNSIRFGIYSSETQSWSLWSNEVEFMQGRLEVDFGRGVYCNGAIHWLTHKDELFYCHIGDCNDENAVRGGLLASPVGLVFDRDRYFGESCGRLHLIDVFKPCVNQFEVRELEPDYSGWVVKYHVDLGPIIETYMPCNNERNYTCWFVKCKADLYSTSYSFLRWLNTIWIGIIRTLFSLLLEKRMEGIHVCCCIFLLRSSPTILGIGPSRKYVTWLRKALLRPTDHYKFNDLRLIIIWRLWLVCEDFSLD